MPIRVKNDKTSVGFLNIVLEILKESNTPSLLGKSAEDRAEVRQWIEYVLLYVTNVENGQTVNNVMKVSIYKVTKKEYSSIVYISGA